MKRFLAVIMIICVCFFMAACGQSKGVVFNEMTSADTAPQQKEQAGAAGDLAANTIVVRDNRKIIRNASLTVETLDFSAAEKAIGAAVQKAGGYISSTALEARSYNDALRTATYECRVPSEKYADFLSALDGAGNVVSKTEGTEDVTAQYVDVEARLKSLHLQEERLFSMMQQAGELETLLAIQNQLTEVQYQIESYTAQQRSFDDLIDYATVTVYLNEVQRVTESKDGFGARVSAAFKDGWYHFGNAVQSVVVIVVYLLPALLIAAVVGAVFFFRWRKKRKNK